MAYQTPKTWVAGEIVEAAELNQDIRDNWLATFPLGAAAFTAWSPVVTQSNTPTQSITWARYFRVARLVVAHFVVSFSAAGTAANAIAMTVPVTAASASAIGGAFSYFDAGNTIRAGTIFGASASSVQFRYDGQGNSMGNGDFVIASGDSIGGFLVLEAAS